MFAPFLEGFRNDGRLVVDDLFLGFHFRCVRAVGGFIQSDDFNVGNHDYVAVFIALEQLVAALVVTYAIHHRHEDGIICHPSGALFLMDFLRRFLLQEKDGCLRTVTRLKGVDVQVDTRENPRLTNEPFADIAEARRTED